MKGGQSPFSESWGNISYTYDGVGNRQTEITGQGQTNYFYTANRLTSTTGQKAFTFSYNSDGNTTGQNAREYVYNQNQRMIEAIEDGNTVGEYVYNGEGQRAKKTTVSGTMVFHYDLAGYLIAESDNSGTISAEYVFLNRSPYAKIEGTNVYYYHNDHLGTPQKMTDASGAVVWYGEFLPFGEPGSVSGTVTNNFRFSGQYFDGETGMHYNWHRDYKPEIGRYIEADPIGLDGGLNLYTYVGNRPVNFADPEGTKVSQCCGDVSSLPMLSVLQGLECMSKCLKVTIYISSGWRTKEQNSKIRGATYSLHLVGLAADVHIPPSKDKLRKAAEECGFFVLPKNYANWVHVDLREGRTAKVEPNECICKQIREKD